MAEIDTYSEDFRHACEVRWVMGQPKAARMAHYAAVAERRGVPASERLRQAVIAKWKRQQADEQEVSEC